MTVYALDPFRPPMVDWDRSLVSKVSHSEKLVEGGTIFEVSAVGFGVSGDCEADRLKKLAMLRLGKGALLLVIGSAGLLRGMTGFSWRDLSDDGVFTTGPRHRGNDVGKRRFTVLCRLRRATSKGNYSIGGPSKASCMRLFVVLFVRRLRRAVLISPSLLKSRSLSAVDKVIAKPQSMTVIRFGTWYLSGVS